MCDNIFDDEDEVEKVLAEKEWKKLMEEREKDGLRDGLADGNEKGLQSGFDEGFNKGFTSVYSLHAMKGVLKAIDENRNVKKDESCIRSLQSLTEQVDELEKRLVEVLVTNPKPDISSEDMSVKESFEEIKINLKVLCDQLGLHSLALYVDHFSLIA